MGVRRRAWRVMVIEDDVATSKLIAAYLETAGFIADTALNAQEARLLFAEHLFDIILLDLSLPDMDGFVLAGILRKLEDTPIIVVTRENDESVRISCLEFGVDDFLIKPFSPRELAARIHNVLRRSQLDATSEDPSSIRFSGGWNIDPYRRVLSSDRGEIVELTKAEFDLVLALVRAKGRVLSRDYLLDAIGSRTEDPSDRTVDVLVSRVRSKLREQGARSPIIVTVSGVGYRTAL